jgi:hypothetical protein
MILDPDLDQTIKQGAKRKTACSGAPSLSRKYEQWALEAHVHKAHSIHFRIQIQIQGAERKVTACSGALSRRSALTIRLYYLFRYFQQYGTSTDPTLFQLIILDLDLDEPINKERKERKTACSVALSRLRGRGM